MTESTQSRAEAPSREDRPRLRRRPVLVLALLVALAAGLAWQWYQSRAEFSALREEVARKLRDADTDSREARLLARQVQEATREAQAGLAQLEAKVLESQSHQIALDALYQELSRGRDEWTLAEVEQTLTLASQQLQLAGNVQAALVALENADARLARADRGQFFSLRKALARDIERLKAAPNLDLAGLALRVDQVIDAVDGLPLTADELSSPARATEEREVGFWARLGGTVWAELRQLLRVRNIERSELPLLAPSQEYFLRENLKLRLLNARIALLDRNESVFRADVRTASTWIARYFDVQSRQAAAVLGNLKQLEASGISIEVPGIEESLAAVRSFKSGGDKLAR
ncbi:MAG: uroporphyrinogen-III C-methyltransferase [Burkholderiales bacterium]|nr:uroporphyrinogen-III C-methyltransferase [Burkholderiales bacterium]